MTYGVRGVVWRTRSAYASTSFVSMWCIFFFCFTFHSNIWMRKMAMCIRVFAVCGLVPECVGWEIWFRTFLWLAINNQRISQQHKFNAFCNLHCMARTTVKNAHCAEYYHCINNKSVMRLISGIIYENLHKTLYCFRVVQFIYFVAGRKKFKKKRIWKFVTIKFRMVRPTLIPFYLVFPM